MYIAILGRQPAIGMAELERVFGDVRWFSDQSAVVRSDSFDIERLGGTLKAGRIVAEIPRADWRQAGTKLVKAYADAWADHDGKITVGLSAYGFTVSARDVQKTGIILKNKLKEKGVSVRLIPNSDAALNTATSHHNKLGLSDNKVELIIIRARSGKVIIAESVGAQNITALARRDQERPKRDAFVGMLPPKLAQIMINLATGHRMSSRSAIVQRETKSEEQPEKVLTESATFPARNGLSADNRRRGDAAEQDKTNNQLASSASLVTDRSKPATIEIAQPAILDPFCGTGVLLQEALLLGYNVIGTDLSDKMIDYSAINLDWIKTISHAPGTVTLSQGDAMNTTWPGPIDAVACETYLGQPFSAPPSPSKLTEVRGNCDHIITDFLRNIGTQLQPGTPLCVAVPAWRANDGSFTHLPLIKNLAQLGYERIELKNVRTPELLYYREDQVVARELLILVKK